MPDPEELNGRHRDIVLGGAGFLGALLLVLLWPGAARVVQPIQYNHQKHLSAGLECSNCHTLFSNTPWAGLPTIDTCTMCHSEASTGTREEAKIVEYVQKGETPPWRQVNQLPTHVYFSHQTHAVGAGMECAVCHGEMQKLTAPMPRPFFAWTMDACINCHAERRATVDCNGCHR
ncbi:MAG: cytochrome c3 family protein [Acidobacteria bacterium]|nr:cytochrome c3 family protein [Acidobacteriota bacterium]